MSYHYLPLIARYRNEKWIRNGEGKKCSRGKKLPSLFLFPLSGRDVSKRISPFGREQEKERERMRRKKSHRKEEEEDKARKESHFLSSSPFSFSLLTFLSLSLFLFLLPQTATSPERRRRRQLFGQKSLLQLWTPICRLLLLLLLLHFTQQLLYCTVVAQTRVDRTRSLHQRCYCRFLQSSFQEGRLFLLTPTCKCGAVCVGGSVTQETRRNREEGGSQLAKECIYLSAAVGKREARPLCAIARCSTQLGRRGRGETATGKTKIR